MPNRVEATDGKAFLDGSPNDAPGIVNWTFA